MLYPLRLWHHLAVLAAVAVAPVLVLLGVMGGERSHPRVESRQVVFAAASDGFHVRDVIDVDFGDVDHGWFRRYASLLDVDPGPQQLVATLDGRRIDAVAVSQGGRGIIEMSEPFRLVSGRHRYVLEFVLPDVPLIEGMVALEVTGGNIDFEQERVEMVLSGFVLDSSQCAVTNGAPNLLNLRQVVATCEVLREGSVDRVLVTTVPPMYDVVVQGAPRPAVAIDVPMPPLPPAPAPADRSAQAIAVGLVALATALVVFAWMWRSGRNLVGGESSADGAFPTFTATARLVSDRRLDRMATIEFGPPPGLEPWQGALLLRERVDADSVSGWFADLLARDFVELRDHGTRLATGRRLVDAPVDIRNRVLTVLGGGEGLSLTSPQPKLRLLWTQIAEIQAGYALSSGWWDRHAPRRPNSAWRVARPYLLIFGGLFAFGWVTDIRHSAAGAVLGAIVLAAAPAALLYRRLLPRRTVRGSALALQTESFRRFLVASEADHVNWAKHHGVLREYSAWAVALGAAKPWDRAVKANVSFELSDVLTDPLHVARHVRIWRGLAGAPPVDGPLSY